MSDELIEVRNCAESYLNNAKYHLLHGGYEKALSFANMARDEINYIINHASQHHYIPATKSTPDKQCPECKGRGLTKRPPDGLTPGQSEQVRQMIQNALDTGSA